jgi:uncharacterized protein (TIGR03084 family)
VTGLADILTDLRDESVDLEQMVAGLDPAGWQRPTPAAGWSIAHQIAHLLWTDIVAVAAATDPQRFADMIAMAAADDPAHLADRAAEQTLAAPEELLRRWRESRSALAAALVRVPPGTRLPWFGTAMSPASMATARLMETWAHGGDVAAALAVVRMPTSRLRHVAHLGVRTLAHSFLSHGRPAPTEPVYVELAAPGGGTWAYGSPGAPNRLTGPALDFCLLVTQRVHPADLSLAVTGPVATEWLEVAQAFAGAPGPGRPPRGPGGPR